jgi:hypothetical protein
MAETHEHHHTEAGHKGAEAHVEKPASRTGSEEAVGCWRSIAGLMSGQGGSGGTPLGWVGTGKRYSKKQRVVLKVVMHHMVFTALAMQCIGHDKKKVVMLVAMGIFLSHDCGSASWPWTEYGLSGIVSIQA